ncbi:MAG: MotA/TolQ/ExbB proton channel family protein [Verrucomicrobiota bacterium]|nr:MotA/TolQ/ExbB proton channel family protein [Verrucomicrobiota bacterium]
MNEVLATSWEYWLAGGPLLVPIALVCLGMWACFFRVRTDLLDAIHVLNGVEAISHGPRIPLPAIRSLLASEICGLARGRPLARDAASAACANGADRDAFLRNAFDEFENARISRLSRDFVIVAALAAAAPLLGLLGTVVGMIDTFQAVAASGGHTAARVSGGISKALITTQFGLAVAIPGVFGLARLRRILNQARALLARARTRLLLDSQAMPRLAAVARAAERPGGAQ